MPSGVMKRWNSEKGFGFIKTDDGGRDLFCHVRDLLGGEGSVQVGDAVKFRSEYDDRRGKDRAVDVEVSGGGGGGSRGSDRSRPRGGGRDSGRDREQSAALAGLARAQAALERPPALKDPRPRPRPRPEHGPNLNVPMASRTNYAEGRVIDFRVWEEGTAADVQMCKLGCRCAKCEEPVSDAVQAGWEAAAAEEHEAYMAENPDPSSSSCASADSFITTN
jgi:CspA family cold shock protein